MELKPLFKDIADAIREKDGTTDEIKAANFPARIRAIQGGGGGGVTAETLEITAPPDKTLYRPGDSFDPTGMAVWAELSNGYGVYVNHSDLTFGPAGPLEPGTDAVTVTFHWGDQTVSTAQEINIVAGGYLYGFDINLSNSNPAARVSYPSDVDNAGFAAAKMNFGGSFSYGDWPDTPGEDFMPRPCMLKFDGTVDYYLNPNDYTQKADGAASDAANINYGGNAMMEWPKIYAKRWEENGVYHFRCSNVKLDADYECWCNYDKNNNEIPHFYTPIYFGSKDSSNRLRSISGQNNSINTTATTEVNCAKANGDDWYIEVVADRFLIQDLLVMMFKSTNLQAAAGYGVCNGSAIKPGTMNTRGMFWGANNQTSGVKVFGMENWWGNYNRRTAGFVCVNGTYKVKITKGTKDGTTVDDYNFDGSGYITLTDAVPTSNGYITSMKTKAFGRVPITGGGSATTYEADSLSYGTGYAYAGGHWAASTNNGPYAIAVDWPASNFGAYSGAAISCKPSAKE